MNRIDEVPTDKPVVIYCNSGKRSRSLKFMIEKLHSLTNIQDLEGGYVVWEENALTV